MTKMCISLAVALVLGAAAAARAEDAKLAQRSFENLRAGATPPGFTYTCEGGWVVKDASEERRGHVLTQSSRSRAGCFRVAVADEPEAANVKVSALCKPDQVGECGLVVRYRDADNYYAAVLNMDRMTYEIFYVKDGKVHTLETKKVKDSRPGTPQKFWLYELKASGHVLTFSVNGREVLGVKDFTFAGAGKAGVFTVINAEFDDLSIRKLAR